MPTNTADYDDVLSFVIEIASAQIGVRTERISHKTRFDDLGCNSCDSLRIVIQIEQRFDISFSNREGELLTTVDALSQLITKKIAEHQPNMPRGSPITALLNFFTTAGHWLKWVTH